MAGLAYVSVDRGLHRASFDSNDYVSGPASWAMRFLKDEQSLRLATLKNWQEEDT